MRKNAKKVVIIKCCFCGNDVIKQKKEFDRLTKKRGQVNFYCNASCAFQKNVVAKNLAQYAKDHPTEMYKRMVSSPNYRSKQNDEFSSFRYFINKSKSKERINRYGISDLTVEYLKEIWLKQNGICPYTGIKMDLPENTQDFHIKGKPNKASLDRIDTLKGYVKGNVEFVCLSVNLAKKDFTREQMMIFFNQIKNTQ